MVDQAEDAILVLFAPPHNLWEVLVNRFVAKLVVWLYSHQAEVAVVADYKVRKAFLVEPDSVREDKFASFYFGRGRGQQVLHEPAETAVSDHVWFVGLHVIDVLLHQWHFDRQRGRCVVLVSDATWFTIRNVAFEKAARCVLLAKLISMKLLWFRKWLLRFVKLFQRLRQSALQINLSWRGGSGPIRGVLVDFDWRRLNAKHDGLLELW